LEYDLEAGLSQCTGISTVGLAKLNELETTDFVTGELGNLSAKVGAVLKVGGVLAVARHGRWSNHASRELEYLPVVA
jgi:hypothetical protein